jgi:hypothetical protein
VFGVLSKVKKRGKTPIQRLELWFGT